ncbi:MAG: DUF5597 domain-containing protein [Rikenellaceae bacterium]|nr:DUF5597 domain-containing protein [Rikenellaceae bacterium]
MMKKTISFIVLLCLAGFTAGAQLPALSRTADGAYRLTVDGEPFLMIAGELHNSSSSTKVYMDALWPRLKSLNLNTVLAAVSWEQFEPEEGVYDYEMVDYLISESRANGLKLCILWFGTWKNGESSYVPMWVKRDTQRFFRMKTADGGVVETVSPFCDAAREADARAFAALMARIREVDTDHTVIMMQPENEVGIFADMDYNDTALAAFEGQVPEQLMKYLSDNKKNLKEEVASVWAANGSKRRGTWKEVFGDNPQAREFLMAWTYAGYMNSVAEAGKAVLPLPMFVNCWIVQAPGDLPGVYPNGGPVSRVMDIWKAGAPSIDVVAPDIYLPDFKSIVREYHRADNPLLIPESTVDPGRAFYAFAEHDALCYSPFAIEDAAGNLQFSAAYEVLGQLMPRIAAHAGTDKMRGIMRYGEEEGETFVFDGYSVEITYEDPEKPAYGLVIQTAQDEFLFAGINFVATVASTGVGRTGYIGQVWEGRYRDGRWEPTRLLNGDETRHHAALRVRGIAVGSGGAPRSFEADNSQEVFEYSPLGRDAVMVPGIYKVTVYTR